MVRVLSTILFYLSLGMVQGQVRLNDNVPFKPLENYDFSGGAHTLVVIPADVSNDNQFALYLRDTVRLNGYRQSWVFKEEAVTYPFACLDGYDIHLLRGQDAVAGFRVSLRCEAFIHEEGYWHLDAFGPLLHIMEMDTAWRKDARFQNLRSARAALAEARSDAGVIFIPETEWEHYDGYFFISRLNPNYSGKAPFADWDKVLADMQKQLESKYPEDRYDVRLASYGLGKHYKQITFRIAGKKAFFDDFSLYPVNDWGWQPFKPKLTVWRSK